MDRRNRILERFERGGVALGARATDPAPTLVEVYGSIGLDFAWLDFEHSGPSAVDGPVFEDLTRAAEVGDVDLLVRLPSGDPELVRKALDAGVRNVLVPRIETAAEVREAVRAGRFRYDGEPGERGAAAARAATWGATPDDYVEREDETVCVGAMIENETAVANLAEILSVPELGFVFVGPSDLSISLGHPRETDHPAVEEAVESVRAAAVEAGVPVGCIANDPETARAAIDDGYQLLRIGDELSAARTVLGERLAALRDGDG